MTDAIPMSEIKQQIVSAYPEQDDQWITEQWGRVIDNIDVIVPELNDDTTMEKHLAHELLAMEFGIYYCDNCSTYTHIADELESCLFHQICGELLCRVASCQRESCRHNESRGFQWNGVNFYQGDKVRYSVYPHVVDGTGVVDYIDDEYVVRSTGQTLLDMDEDGLSEYCHVWSLYDIKKDTNSCQMKNCEYTGDYGDDFIRVIHMPNHGDFWICEDCHEELTQMQAYRPTDADTWIAVSIENLNPSP